MSELVAQEFTSTSNSIIDLNNGFTLHLVDQSNLPKKMQHYNAMGVLFYNGEQISEHLFREGGMHKSNDKFCQLICYTLKEGEFGKHCIVNLEGEICLSQENGLKYPYLLQGVLAQYDDKLYNLSSKQIITSYDGSLIKGNNYIIACNSYSFGNRVGEKGIYLIDINTGTFKIIDTIK